MGHRSHVRLPSLTGWSEPVARPSLEQARQALGGPGEAGARAGWGVVVEDPRHGSCPGVVLCDRGEELDVWIGEGLIAKVRTAMVQGSLAAVPASRFAEVATDVRRFSELREGEPIQVLGTPAFAGILRERCRFGGLVERVDDPRSPRPVMAIGFRRLAPRDG